MGVPRGEVHQPADVPAAIAALPHAIVGGKGGWEGGDTGRVDGWERSPGRGPRIKRAEGESNRKWVKDGAVGNG